MLPYPELIKCRFTPDLPSPRYLPTPGQGFPAASGTVGHKTGYYDSAKGRGKTGSSKARHVESIPVVVRVIPVERAYAPNLCCPETGKLFGNLVLRPGEVKHLQSALSCCPGSTLPLSNPTVDWQTLRCPDYVALPCFVRGLPQKNTAALSSFFLTTTGPAPRQCATPNWPEANWQLS